MKKALSGVLALSIMSTSIAFGQTANRIAVHQEIVNKVKKDNVVWSAASLDNLLSLVGGAYEPTRKSLVGNYLGRSVEEAAKLSTSLNTKNDNITVSSANNVWYQEDFSIKNQYQNFLTENFQVTPQPMDVYDPNNTADSINKWIADRTNKMLGKVIKPDIINSDLVTLLVNALYFKGAWDSKFDKEKSTDLPFQVVSKENNSMTIENRKMMVKTKTEIDVAYNYNEDLGKVDHTIVKLPFKGKTHSLYITFANTEAESYDSPIEVDASKNVSAVYKEYISEGKAFTKRFGPLDVAHFSMPKFTIESELKDIQDDLSNHGYERLFDKGVLTNLTDDSRAFLAFIFQKAKIVINEEGGEAAAVTVGGIFTESISIPRILKINGPFAFAIRDEVNKTNLFEGMVRNPKE